VAVRPTRWDRAGRQAGRLHQSFDIPNLGDKVHRLARVLRVADEQSVYLALASQWDDAAALTGLADEPRTLATDPSSWPRGASLTETMLYLDTTMALADGMLCKVDRASMSVGLEARVPLLDHRIVELAWRLPMSMKIRGSQGKWVVRQVLDRHVPRSLIERPKMGFDPPVGAWMRGPLRSWADDLLDPRRLADQGWLDPAPIRARWDEHQRGSRNWDYDLWTVLQLQSWLEAG
jgi:asparagine synthase (glutamine-hydrolysing)